MNKSCINCGSEITHPKSDYCDDCGDNLEVEWLGYIPKIEKQIKKLYGTKEKFCEAHGYDYKNFSKKLKTVQNQLKFCSDFCEPLQIRVRLKKVKKT